MFLKIDRLYTGKGPMEPPFGLKGPPCPKGPIGPVSAKGPLSSKGLSKGSDWLSKGPGMSSPSSPGPSSKGPKGLGLSSTPWDPGYGPSQRRDLLCFT